jgi:hypothetical protein
MRGKNRGRRSRRCLPGESVIAREHPSCIRYNHQVTSGWRSRWLVTVASDVSARDGIGWEFATLRQEDVWAVFREDGGPFPVFSAARGQGALPPLDELEAMTQEAVADLLAASGLPDTVGWITGEHRRCAAAGVM